MRHAGEELGLLVLKERAGSPLTPIEERLFADLARQAGLVLRGVRLRPPSASGWTELSARETELRVSRERLLDAQDEARRRLERDIHDGAQQHLVALAVNLRLAETLTPSPDRAIALLDTQERAAHDAVHALTQLSRGIYPPHARRARGRGRPARRRVGPGRRRRCRAARRGTPRAVETAAYFCALEALQNAGKHAGAEQVQVEVDAAPGVLTVTVTDDGRGFDPAVSSPGTGLANMRDRVDSAGGTLTIDAARGRGARVRVSLPADGSRPGGGA